VKRRNPWKDFGTPRGYEATAAKAAAELARVIDNAPILYHGGNLRPGRQDRPLFLTASKYGAEWFVSERGGSLWEVAKPKNLRAATLDQLLTVCDALGVEQREIPANSPYSGDNVVDLVYVPRVRRALEKAGCNALICWDALENSDIPTLVVWNVSVRAKKVT
jgi:hypothetical protein